MDFKCKFCSEFFSSDKNIIAHLRKTHKIIDNTDRIPCVVNNSCKKSYLTFSGLRTHMKTCINTEPIQPVCINYDSMKICHLTF